MTRQRVDVSVLTTGHDVADARLHRLVSVLTVQDLVVEVDGLGSASDAPSGVAVRTRARRSLAHRLQWAVRLPWRARGRVLLVLDPELVPAATLCRLVQTLRGSSRARQLIVDVHEDYARALADRTWAHGVRLLVARLIVAAALAAAPRADLTVVADDHLPPHRARCRLVLPNLPLPAMLPPRTELESSPRALYVGDVRRSRGLHTMLAVVEQCPAWTLDVVGPLATADQAWLARWRATSPARDRVTFHGRQPPRAAWRLAAGAWVGFCLLDTTPAFTMALPSKVYEYLSCGLAVVTSPLPRAAALVSEAGAGTVVADARGAVTALRAWSEQPVLVRAYQEAARTWTKRQTTGAHAYAAFTEEVTRLATSELAGPGDFRRDNPTS